MYKKLITLTIFTFLILLGNNYRTFAETDNYDKPQIKLVKHDLYQKGNFYYVKGKVYNPYDKGCKNVIIKCFVWKNLKGANKTKYGSIVTETGGLVTARIDYFPPKTMLEFETAEKNAPVYTSIQPYKIDFEIYAEWE